MLNKFIIYIIILLALSCSQKDIIFSAQQVRISKNNKIMERDLIHEECFMTSSSNLKNINILSIDIRENLSSKSIKYFKVSRKLNLIAIVPSFFNLSGVYEECYKFEGIIANDFIKD